MRGHFPVKAYRHYLSGVPNFKIFQVWVDLDRHDVAHNAVLLVGQGVADHVGMVLVFMPLRYRYDHAAVVTSVDDVHGVDPDTGAVDVYTLAMNLASRFSCIEHTPELKGFI